jgi:hypothetical protein
MGEDYALGAHRLQTELDHPYGSVGWYHILDMHADRITAGAMVIRGNGPYLVVQDEEYNERVRVYQEGIIVKYGRIAVQNQGNEQIIDGKGINGSNVFYSSAIQKQNPTTIRGWGEWYPIDELQTGIYLTRDTPVFIFGTLSGGFIKPEGTARVRLQAGDIYFPGSGVGSLGWDISQNATYPTKNISFTFQNIINIKAGANLIRLMAYYSGSTDVIIYSGGSQTTFGYIILGNG